MISTLTHHKLKVDAAATHNTLSDRNKLYTLFLNKITRHCLGRGLGQQRHTVLGIVCP